MLGFPGFSLVEDETKCAEVKGNDISKGDSTSLGLSSHIYEPARSTQKLGMHLSPVYLNDIYISQNLLFIVLRFNCRL